MEWIALVDRTAPKGQNKIAQGNALGTRSNNFPSPEGTKTALGRRPSEREMSLQAQDK